MTTPKTLVTADELLRMPEIDRRYELVRGRVIEKPFRGFRDGHIATLVGWHIGEYVERNRLGATLAGGTGFQLERDPDTVLAPAVSFVSRERLPSGKLPEGYFDGAPDLVVEVVSPSGTAGNVQAKVEEWLHAGAQLVWVLYPDIRTVAAYRAVDDIRVFTEDDELSGDPVVPGFSCPVSEIF